MYEKSRFLPWVLLQLSTIVASTDESAICEWRRNTKDERRQWQFYTRVELVSRRCTLIRLLCTVIGYDIKFFTRLSEQMEANRGRRSCTEFSLGLLGHQLVSRRQVSRSQINILGSEDARMWFSIKQSDINGIATIF